MKSTTQKSAAKKSSASSAKSKTPAAKKPAQKSAKPAAQNAKSSAKVSKVQNKNTASSKGSSQDIVQLILEDHKALKQLIKIMKDSDNEMSERQEAFEEFAPLLVTHAKPEEETLYVFMKKDEDMREDGFEGDVEHMLADQLLEEIKRTEDEDLWSARVKVLAELVEHHIEEEEEEMLPEFKKEVESEQRAELGQTFLQLKAKYEDMGGKDTVNEGSRESRSQR